jgi:DNA-binding transcriptional regulator YbjK
VTPIPATPTAASDNGTELNPSTDRRLAKGRRRREQIVAAAAALSVRRGLGELTHRQIAERASVPLSATTYYFTTLTEIQVEAARHITQRLVARFAKELETIETNKIVDVARPLVRALLPLHTSTVVGYQWYLDAVRIPEVRAVIVEWNHSVVELLTRRFAEDTATAAEIVAIADGLLLAAMAEESTRATTLRRMTRALARFDGAARANSDGTAASRSRAERRGLQATS